MANDSFRFSLRVEGSSPRAAGAFDHVHPGLAAAVAAVALASVACSSEPDERTLQPMQVAMTAGVGPSYDDGEITLYEVKLPVALPIRTPSREQQRELNRNPVAPYPGTPWFTSDDVKVQVSYTVTNLDAEAHNVELLVDPWNEFGRYWPGFTVVDVEDEELQPNLSGINILFQLPGTDSGDSSRRIGTFTFDDMDELAFDFGTAINIIENVPPPDPNDPNAAYTGPSTLVNNAFARPSYDSPLVRAYMVDLVPGLTGFDIGLRTREPANIAVEIVIELKDESGEDLLAPEGDNDPTYEEPTDVYTTGTVL